MTAMTGVIWGANAFSSILNIVTDDFVPVFAEDEHIVSIITIQNNFENFYGKRVRIEGVFLQHGEDPVFRMVMRQDFSC